MKLEFSLHVCFSKKVFDLYYLFCVQIGIDRNTLALISARICPGNCGFQTLSGSSFTTHISKIRMCHICKKEFHGRFARREFISHMKKHNKANNEKERTCPYCGIVFKYRSELTKHKRSRCYQTQGRDKVHSLSKSKALGATRSDNVENKIRLDKNKVTKPQ